LIILAVASLIVSGCGAFVGSGDAIEPAPPQGPRAPATQPVAVGQIDDDRGAEDPDTIIEMIALYPVRLIGSLIDFSMQEIRILEGDTPSKAVRMTIDSSSADNRRQGVYKLVEYDFAHKPPYTTRYEQMAQSDPDATVRAAAMRACNRSRDRNATKVFIGTLADPKETDAVRLEAAKGLCNLPDPAAVGVLLGVANSRDANRDLRVASVDGLKYYRSMEVGRALGNLLADRDFAVAWQARRSLVYMTHRDFKMDQGAWLGFIAGPEKPLE
jgi:hypothetical protein